jgi:hypothetical protein
LRSPDCFFDLILGESPLSWLHRLALEVSGDRDGVDLEPLGQVGDGGTGFVGSHEVGDLIRLEPALDLLGLPEPLGWSGSRHFEDPVELL